MKSDPRKNLNDYARYSSMAIQMLVIILLGVFSGFKLDQWLHTKPILTVILSISSVALSIFIVVKDLLRK
ncbi:MAG: AtpZ/AtpI family protein [Bacteroidales bacterium]|nr:AtpZ/AtpI family protein [Bacteroidales bacterium]MDD4602299.1 AtpZ/AtpI family protein [Bacteroidales bacterium]